MLIMTKIYKVVKKQKCRYRLCNGDVITLSCMLQKDIGLYYQSLWPTTMEFSILEPFSIMICHITWRMEKNEL